MASLLLLRLPTTVPGFFGARILGPTLLLLTDLLGGDWLCTDTIESQQCLPSGGGGSSPELTTGIPHGGGVGWGVKERENQLCCASDGVAEDWGVERGLTGGGWPSSRGFSGDRHWSWGVQDGRRR